MEAIDRRYGDDDDGTQLLSSRRVLDRFGISDRTLEKWVTNKRLGFPRPVYINKRKYFLRQQLINWERAQISAHVGGAA